MVPDDPELSSFAEKIYQEEMILMADESACSLSEIKRLVKSGHYKMINVRLSKCGGFRRSLEIINYLRRKNVPFQIGCQLGESGLLSAAGRALSLMCMDSVYYDGCYDEYLLAENITCENVSFGYEGKAGPLEGSGLGVKVDRKKLMRLSSTFPTAVFPGPQ